MSEDKQNIEQLVNAYCMAIHTQKRADFLNLWSDVYFCTLISIGTLFQGKETICEEFLINAIQRRYERIALIADALQINMIDDRTALVYFSYHTECLLRDSHENYGIHGMETQLVKKENGQWKLVHIHYSKVND